MKKISFSQRVERLSQSQGSPPPTFQDQVLDNIRDRKCHIVKVKADERQPGYAYSVGLWHHFGYPEVIAFGQSGEQLVGDIQTLVKVGQPPPVQKTLGKPEGKYPAQLQPIEDEQWISSFLNVADWFYDRESFPVLELLWN